MIIPLKRVISGSYVRDWCKLSYPDHPKGCPMYNTRPSCPPQAPLLEDLVKPPFYLVLQEFDLEQQEKRMKLKHPDWSVKMCRNPRYWQKSFMKQILAEAQQFLWKFPQGMILVRPEANGVNLFSTCRLHGVRLERNPQKIVKKMVLIGARV